VFNLREKIKKGKRTGRVSGGGEHGSVPEKDCQTRFYKKNDWVFTGAL